MPRCLPTPLPPTFLNLPATLLRNVLPSHPRQGSVSVSVALSLTAVPSVGRTGSLVLCLLALSLHGYRSYMTPWLLNGFLAVHACPQPGRTPLHLAARRGQFEAARLLLRYGAEVDAKDGVSRDGWLHPWRRTGNGQKKESSMALSFLV